jgi:hypothetical protein
MTLLVVIVSDAVDRVAEALRAAIGMCLRGDQVQVLLRRTPPPDPRIERALATLRELGFVVRCPASDQTVGEAIRTADKVEVWT